MVPWHCRICFPVDVSAQNARGSKLSCIGEGRSVEHVGDGRANRQSLLRNGGPGLRAAEFLSAYRGECLVVARAGCGALCRAQYASRAMDVMRQAVAKGFGNARLMQTDHDLDCLRSRNDFKKLLAEVEQKAKK